MKTKTKTQPQRTCEFKKIMARMPPRSHWPKRPEEFRVSDSQVVWFIRNKTGTTNWSHAMKLYWEARKNKVILYDPITRMWRGYLHAEKSAKLPTKWKPTNPPPARRPDVPGRPPAEQKQQFPAHKRT